MSRPWMPLYVADYLADTGHLSTAEHGAYLLLIMHYWQKGGLPTDDARLASIARAMPEQWLSMKDTLAEFFGEGWRHTRIDAELQSAREAYQRRASAGRKGGKARAMPEQCSSNAKAGLKQSQSQPLSSDAIASDAAAPRDVRDALWTEGVSVLSEISGKPTAAAKSLIGKWLKEARDDCALVLSKIRTARADRIGEPVSWISAAIRPPPDRPKKTTLASMWRDEGRKHGILPNDDTPQQINGRLEASHARGSNPGADHARLVAGPSDG